MIHVEAEACDTSASEERIGVCVCVCVCSCMWAGAELTEQL